MTVSNSSEDVPRPIEAALHRVEPLLKRSEADKRPVALMMCGCAGTIQATARSVQTCKLKIICTGSGKSTLSKTVAARLPSFKRISIDGINASRHGLYGIDYPKSEHKTQMDEADKIFQLSVEQILIEGQDDIILDRAFYAKEDRDLYRDLVENRGGRCVLVYLNAPKEVLWQRICARREAGITADSALEISEALLDTFFDGFEVPHGEGEVVVDTLS